MKTAVVILNWNGKSFLEKFLPNVIENSKGDVEIIVADNDSTDDSVEFMKQNFPDIRVIVNDENGGFAKGYNDALAKVEAEYYVLLNSDIEVSPGWIDPIIELMDSDKNIGACQPKLLAYHDKNQFEYAGAAGGYIDKFGYPFCRGRIFQESEIDVGQYNDTREVFWATGACLFVRAELYHKFGGLDNDFFAHMEEIDFCWRLKLNGYKVMYCGESVVYHVGGGTLPKKSARKTYLNFRNNFVLLYKNLPKKDIPRVFFIRILLDWIAALKFLMEGGTKDFMAVLRAHIDFYKQVKIHKKKRAGRDIKKVNCVYDGSIVKDHYLSKVKFYSQLDESKILCETK